MQLKLREEDQGFQEEVVTFLSENLDQDLSQKVKHGYPRCVWYFVLSSLGFIGGL